MQSEPEILSAAPTLPGVEAQPRPQRLRLHVGLFVATFASAMWFQSIDWAHASSWADAIVGPLVHPRQLRDGFVFAVTLLSILLAHEMGHYLVARRYRVDQTLPYFIPAPTLFGTLGAVILMRSQPANRRVLLRVAAAGPFAGLVVALPAAAWGLAHSLPADVPEPGGSLLWHGLVTVFAPAPADYLTLHPVAFAAWAGLLVTALNLIPAAQLDGGHIAYALFGKRQLAVSRAVVVLLLAMGIFLGPQGAGVVWLVWAVLLALVGLRHPPVRDDTVPLSPRERAGGWLALALFVLTFVPVPLVGETVEGEVVPQLEYERSLEAPPSRPEEYRL